MYIFYNLFLIFSFTTICFLSLFSKDLRNNIKIRLRLPKFKLKSDLVHFWFHASSVGEYEQARPVLLELRKKYPNCKIFMSVFSYSAFTQCNNDQIYDFFFALPFDFTFYMKRLVLNIRPRSIFYSRYDVWPNLAKIAYEKNIGQILISATLSENSLRNKYPFSKFYQKVYSFIDQIYTIDTVHQDRFKNLGLSSIVLGDTRYDAVKIKSDSKKKRQDENTLKTIQKYATAAGKKIFLGGSTYKVSEEMLIELLQKRNDLLLILAPHHIKQRRMEEIEKKLNSSKLEFIKYKKILQSKKIEINTAVILVDRMGILRHLYSIADYCYVGGGWQGKIHSVIEPAFYGVPILTGPNIKNSQDALDLKEIGLVSSIRHADISSVEKWIRSRQSKRNEIYKKVNDYLKNKSNASKKIVDSL